MSVFGIIYSDFNEARLSLKEWFFCRKQAIRMDIAINLADTKQRGWNKQFIVMLMNLPSGDRLVSIHRDKFLEYQRAGLLPKRLKWSDCKRQAFYRTPECRNNKATPQERTEAKEKYIRYAKRYMKGAV
ncbi:hypothetical protein IR083_19775 [Dysgonomonas sp. GY75]|uniref:hypothetical protein n=1 Tax=Dysgonomonas sp. GY75 TaxID=2780419 RepID=UPI0018833FB3|nr:hypothetical protein [Dysgonomonas sp. GY75]MBF0651060.1 hypothetical protein [Dysgonomonas sp. GY75]